MSKTHVFRVWVTGDVSDVSEAFDRLNNVEGVIEIDYEDSYDD